MKVKVSRNIGLLVGKDGQGKKVYENAFANINEDEGTEIEISEKDYKYVQQTLKRVIKCQEILEKKIDVPEEYSFVRHIKKGK